jgi:translocation and assembly module TamB
VQGKLELNVPALRELGPLTGFDARFSGTSSLTLIATGTLGNPELTGTLAADDVRVAAPRHSVFLTGGRTRVELADREVRVAELSIRGGAGRLTAASRIPQQQTGDMHAIDWRAENFRLLASPTRYLVLEGSGSLALQGRQPVARGELRVTEALFSADTFDTLRLTDDVVIAGRDPPRGAGRDAPLPIDADIIFDFGNNFRIREAGIDATLAGRLRVRSNAAGELLAEGTVDILRGTYIVYGQTLNIENGRLYFDGPADNPRLDITAMRRNMAVEAGVRITGTAQEPRVQLVSDPPYRTST